MKKMLALALAVMMMMSCFSAMAEDKVIRFGHSYDATTLDPHNCTDDGSYYILNNIVEPLVVGYGNDVHPGVAETWEPAADGTSIVFHLRQSNWSDGTPLTAQDFVYSVQRILDPNAAFENTYKFYIIKNAEKYNLGQCSFEEVGVKALDEYTLQYDFEYPQINPALALSGYAFAPVNQAACEKFGTAYGAEAENVLTNGPFVATEWLHQSKITIKKNANYWNAENVKLDEVQFIVGATGQVGVDLFMAGDLDVGLFSTIDHLDTLSMLGLEGEFRLSGFNFLNMNVKGSSEKTAPFMSNANFRKALSSAISREDVLRVANITGEAAYRIAPPTLPSGKGGTWAEDYPMQGWSTKAEPEKAKAYLDAALQELNVTIDQVPEIVMLCYDSQSNMVKLQAVQDMIYQAIGVNCVISPQPIQQMFSMVNNAEFDLWVGGKTVELPDWIAQVGYEFSGEIGNISGYEGEEYIKLYKSLNNIVDSAERAEIIAQMEQIIMDELLTLHLYWSSECTIAVDGISGIEDMNGYGPYFANADFVK